MSSANMTTAVHTSRHHRSYSCEYTWITRCAIRSLWIGVSPRSYTSKRVWIVHRYLRYKTICNWLFQFVSSRNPVIGTCEFVTVIRFCCLFVIWIFEMVGVVSFFLICVVPFHALLRWVYLFLHYVHSHYGAGEFLSAARHFHCRA